MTLVVSDISRYGIVMVGDSAITGTTDVTSGAVKVQYSAIANIGFALWGDARVGDTYMDRWLAKFIETQVHSGDTVLQVGERLAVTLNPILQASGRSWDEMRRGIHIAGYRGDIPMLYHLNTGPVNGLQRELRLGRDYPDMLNISDDDFRVSLNRPDAFCHLRNGYFQHFAALFDGMIRFSTNLKVQLNIDFPRRSLVGRLDFYKTTVRVIAEMLVAAQEGVGVNDKLSAIAFTRDGISENQIQQFPDNLLSQGGRFTF